MVFTSEKLLLFEDILNELKRKKQKGRFPILGINGIDGSGKTKFAENFRKFLSSNKINSQIIHIDDFCNPKRIRYSGKDQVYNCFYKTFSIDRVINELLIPARNLENYNVKLKLLNLSTDRYEVYKKYVFKKDTIIIFEGVYLFRKEFIRYIDYKIFLNISFGECKKRIKNRDGETVVNKLDTKYLPAQRKYIKEYSPIKIADMVVDNTDWNYPKYKINFNK